MDKKIVQETLSRYSDEIPIETYRKLVLDLAAGDKEFALACGIVA